MVACGLEFVFVKMENLTIRRFSRPVAGDVVRYGDGKSLEVVVGSLGERLLDRVVAVRLAVARVVGDWLLHLRDRYSHFHRLLPLLLSCTCDEMDEVRAEALELWDAAGRQFLKENEEELKDRMDFLEDTPQHYPPDVRRPNLGCRVLAQRNASKVLPALERELGDWIPDARLKASQLLGVLLLNAESHMTQHLEKILGVLCRACADTDPAVGRNAEKAAELVGYFVVPGVYCRLLLPALEADPGPGHLRALAGVLRGSERAGLAEQLPLLADLLQGRHLRCSRDAALQLQLLGCCAALMLVCREDCRAVSQQLFAVLLSVLALGADGSVARRATDLMEELRTLEGVASMADLYARHISPVLRDLEADDAPWTAHSPKRFIFQAVVQHSGEAICSSLEAVGRIMVRLAKPDADPEVKVKMFTVVSALFLERHSSLEGCSGLEDFVKVVIEDVVAGNLVWRAGRTAEAVRAAAVTLLWAVLRGSAPVPRPLVASCLPLLLSLVEDSLPRTRLTALRALARLARAAFTADTIHKVLPAASQRLDDVSDDVRSAAVSLIVSLCDPLPADFDVLCSSAVVDALYSTMLLHLDDPAPSFQAIMLDALKKLAHVNPRLLHEKVHASLSVSRNTQGNEILLAHVEALLASTSS
ncbi:dynein axonemal assembly factor 5 isoform X2 [Bacillus rossius redtenbacheri]|uniref:dynein axonemal assembly factor 5 isoform X2 n=1 Tax=Bacillus rossius redtenbacheri TaxID=93214 RepID=UPI002FDE345C